jgi:hypothetical protein
MAETLDATDRPVYSVLELTTPEFSATLVGADGVTPIPGSTLSTLVLTVYCEDADLTIVNGRNAQNVLQTNGVTVDEAGLLTWTLSADDLAILHDTLPFERHIALFEWTWPTAKAGKFECVFAIRNLAKVT